MPQSQRKSTTARGSGAPWYADGLRFDCTRCGNCCGGPPGYVWVEQGDIRAIAAQLGLDPAEFVRWHTRPAEGRRSLLELSGGDCEFLERRADGKTGCRIHAVRPAQCRTWPFWDSNVRTRRGWDAAGRGCPGINRGRSHPLMVIQSALAENEAAALAL